MMIFDKRLHSCPLCGATDIYFEEKYFGGMTQIDIGCAKCGLKGSKSFLSTAKDIEEKVIEYWNHRVPDEDLRICEKVLLDDICKKMVKEYDNALTKQLVLDTSEHDKQIYNQVFERTYSIIASDLEDKEKVLKIQELVFDKKGIGVMKVKEFDNYEIACNFRDKVDGQIQWTSYKGKQLWYVWYQ